MLSNRAVAPSFSAGLSEDQIQCEDDAGATKRLRLQICPIQTRQLAEYYPAWAASGNPRAPKYRKVDNRGNVDEVHDRVFAALA